jgi:uncharacterized membrane protein
MKIYRILSIGWAALCIFIMYPIYGLISYALWLDEGSISPGLCLFVFFMLLAIGGAVASVVLHRGFTWARILLCIIAMLSVLFCVGQEVTHFRSDPTPLQAVFILVGIFSLISVVVFLIPKRYVV